MMMSQAMYRKWRPQVWESVVGQEHVIQTLRNAIAGGRVAHAYLFAGPRGTGKTTTARLLAKAVNCTGAEPQTRPCNTCEFCLAVNAGRFLDLIEIDAASNTSVEDVRDLRDKINFAPTQGQYKVYIIDEVHMLSTAAFNALLKTLEEPPPHAIFILATTEVHKIPATVLSRCQRHEFRRIPVEEIRRRLQHIAAEEGIQVTEEALLLIARQATGALRDAESLLDQLASTGKPIDLEMAQQVLGSAASQVVIDVVDALLAQNASAGLHLLHKALDGGADPRALARQVTEYLRGLMLVKMGNAAEVDATTDIRARMAQHAAGFTTARLLETIRLFNAAATDIRSGWQPSLPLEMAFVSALEEAQPVPAVQQPPALQKNVQADVLLQSEPVLSQQPPAAARTPAPPPAAAQPEPEPAPPQHSSGTVSLREIQHNWSKIKAYLKQQKKFPVEALLNSCMLADLKDNLLILAFKGDFYKDKMESNDNISSLRQAIAQVTGAQVQIKCTVSSASRSKKSGDVEVEDGGIVSAALDLGGEIVDIQ